MNLVYNKHKHIINQNNTILDAIKKLNALSGGVLTLFISNGNDQIIGSLTDGDIRRSLEKGFSLQTPVENCMLTNFKYLDEGIINVEKIIEIKKSRIKLLPVLSHEKKLIRFYDLKKYRSVLPLDCVIMAGGKGKRLLPLTENTPKPMLKLGNKPILEHNLDSIIRFGIENYHISVNYLAEQIEDYFGNGSQKEINIKYLKEEKPSGTAGSLSLIKKLNNDILLTNSDLLTNINYEDLFLTFKKRNADIAVASIPYSVNIPFAILYGKNNEVSSFKEKPSNTHYANAGIYILKKELLDWIPKNGFFDITDLIQKVIDNGKKVVHNPIIGYWIDIGTHEDFKKAKEIIKHLQK